MLKALTTKSLALATAFLALSTLTACDTDAEDGVNARQSFEVDIDQETLDRLLAPGHVDPIEDDFRIYAPDLGQGPADGIDQLKNVCLSDLDPDAWEDTCGFCTCWNDIIVCVDLVCEPELGFASADPGCSPNPEGNGHLDLADPITD